MSFRGISSLLKAVFWSQTAQCAPESHTIPGMTPIDTFDNNSQQSSVDTGYAGSNDRVSRPPPVGFNQTGDKDNVSSEAQGPLSRYGTNQANPAQTIPEPVKIEFTKDGRTNPGQFDKADQEAQRILKPEIYDGCRFEHNKPLGQQFTVSHSLWLGSEMLPNSGNTYQFGSTVVLNEGRTMMLGRMSDDMRLDAQIHHELIQPQVLVARVISSIGNSSDQSITHGSVEFNGIDFASSVRLAKGPLVAFSYFQSVTKRLSLGAEAFYHHSQGISHISARGCFKSEALAKLGKQQPPYIQNGQSQNISGDIVNCTVSTMGGANISYVRKVSDRVSLAAEFECNLGNFQTSANIGYEFLLRQCKISGVISTDGTIQNQIQEAIAPGFNIVFNSILNHKKDTHRFGYGVQIG